MAITKTKRDTRRTGNNPLSYMGVEPLSPPNLTTDNRAPTPNDYAGFFVGDMWVDRSTEPHEDVYMLVNKDNNVARWLQLRDEDFIKTLTGNNPGEIVGPDVLQNIDILGALPLVVTGNAAAWTLTISTDGTLATEYHTDTGVNAVPALNVLNILGGELIGTFGAGNTVTANLDRGADGQLIIGSGTGASVYANIASGDNSITIANGANTIGLSAGTIARTFLTDLTSPATPNAAFQLQILGGELIGTVGGGNSVTVNLDRGSDGQVIIASGTGASAYANITSPDNSITVANGANTIGLSIRAPITGIGYYNIGLSVTTGPNIITIHSADGTAFSANNPGIVSFASKAVAGTFVRVEITANVTMAWTDMTGNTMGTQTGLVWAEILPLYVYAVLNDSENAVMFGLGRMPHHSASGITANIGTPAVANANNDLSLFLFDSVTIGSYDDNPVVVLGSLKVTKDATNAWTFTSPVVGGDTGIGSFQTGTQFVFPHLQNGATSTFLWAPAGTVPTFATGGYWYHVYPNGFITIDMVVSNCTVIGVGTETLAVMTPLIGTIVRDSGTFCVGDASVSVAAVRGVYRGLFRNTMLANGFFGMQFVKNEVRRLQCADFDTTNIVPSQLTGSHSWMLPNNKLP